MKTKKIVLLAILVSIGIVLSIVESLFPLPIPSVKIGLANIATLIALYLYSEKEAFIVQIFRIFMVGIIYSGILSISFILSLSSGLMSFLIMFIVYKLKKASIFTVSVLGSIVHSITQLIISMIMLNSMDVIYFIPIMILLSIVSGYLTSFISYLVLIRFKINLNKPKLLSTLIYVGVLLVSISSFVVFKTYNKKTNEYSYVTITYQNEDILLIDLKSPNNIKELNNNDAYQGMQKTSESYLYYFLVYNVDFNEYNRLIVEVFNNRVRIKEEVSSKHICSKMGYINNKYERLICLPNSFIISISDSIESDIDLLM